MADQRDWWDANQRNSTPEIVDNMDAPCSESLLSTIIHWRAQPTYNFIQQEIDRRILIPAAEELELPIELIPAEVADSDLSPMDSKVIDRFSQNRNDIITPLHIIEEPIIMAVNANEMGVFQLIRPEPFSRERGSANVDDFLDTLELTFLYLERQVVDPGRRERAKVLALQSHLEGKAKAFLIALRPASKTNICFGRSGTSLTFSGTT